MTKKQQEYLRKIKDRQADAILEALAAGKAVWRRPWSAGPRPRGILSPRPYSGANLLAAWAKTCLAGYKSNLWLTVGRFAKIKREHPEARLGAGFKTIPVVFWSPAKTILDKDGNPVTGKDGNPKVKPPAFAAYNVFNADEISGLDLRAYATAAELAAPLAGAAARRSMAEAEAALLARYANRPAIAHSAAPAAFYDPAADRIAVPPPERFESPAEYCSTLAHELVHSTGHKSRLDRPLADRGQAAWSLEELVAEMGAAMLTGDLFPDDRSWMENSAAYIDGWSKALRANPNWFAEAWNKAFEAYCLVTGRTLAPGAGQAEAEAEEEAI